MALIGFSYGAMASMYGLSETAARAFGQGGERFAAHVAFYGPCIARFEEPRTTGAPLLMLYGTEDELIDPARCAAAAEAFRSGGSTVEVIAYEGAAHQWDGAWGPVRIGRLLNGCDLELARDGSVRDRSSGLVMAGRISRAIILGLCVDNRPLSHPRRPGGEGALERRSRTLPRRSVQPALSPVWWSSAA